MDATEAARREAERMHRANVAAGGDPTRPLEFALREATSSGLDVYALQEGDPQLKGGRATFDSQAGSILHEDRGSEFERAFLSPSKWTVRRPFRFDGPNITST